MPKQKTKATAKKVAGTGYVDGFVLVVPKDKVAEYRNMARHAAKVWKKHGALTYRECMIEDEQPPLVTFFFPKMIKAKPDETVWFSYIEYTSKKHRNDVNKKVMKELEKDMAKYKDMPMPFDMKRMAYGGFKVMVTA